MLALQELPSRRLARLGRTEEDREPEMLGRIIGGAEDPLCYLGQRSDAIPWPPRGPVPTRISLRTRFGACSVISCATMPPIEKPSTSILFKPSARLKAIALAPICSNVVGTSPELLETPALLNKITSRSRAKPSVTAGSQ